MTAATPNTATGDTVANRVRRRRPKKKNSSSSNDDNNNNDDAAPAASGDGRTEEAAAAAKGNIAGGNRNGNGNGNGSNRRKGDGGAAPSFAGSNNNNNNNSGGRRRKKQTTQQNQNGQPSKTNPGNNNSNNNGGAAPNNNNNNNNNGIANAAAAAAAGGGPSKREGRKMGKRAKQLESMAKKAKGEDDYFRQCQRDAAKQQQQNNHRNRQDNDNNQQQQQEARELALFGKQGAKGINFAKYDDIKVEVKPGADKVAAQNNKRGQRTNNLNKNNNNNTAATNNNNDVDIAALTFSDFSELQQLSPAIQNNVRLMKYTKSTPIQRHSIPLALAGHDLMCCAQTGSGKTCAFLVPVVAGLGNASGDNNGGGGGNGNSGNGGGSGSDNVYEPVKPKCIVLAPTRELAIQIELEAQKLCFRQPHLNPVAVYGGASQQKQLRQLAFAASAGGGSGSSIIVVATPGRLTDFVDRGLISLGEVRHLILDEADRMLDMGFEPQIRKLVLRSDMTPRTKRQTLLFSATFPDKIQLLASEFLKASYTWIAVGRVGSTTDSITQVIVEATADKRHKLQLTVEALRNGPAGRTLIFVQKKRTATWLKKQLSKGGPEGFERPFDPIDAVEIHGDRSQSQREAALAKFRSGECLVLVATDVAARGLDIDGVEHVINMDLPEEFDSYVHRIGRTGRAGHTGLATSLYVPGDAPKVGNRKISRLLIGQLREAKQVVPEFLETECANNGGESGAKKKFGGRDVRGGGGGGTRQNGGGRNRM